MSPELTVSIDAMGGDAGPGVVMAALSRSLVRHPNVRFLLHGDEALLKPLLAKRAKLAARAAVRHSAEQVRMEEKPGQALRRGRNTSMWRAIESGRQRRKRKLSSRPADTQVRCISVQMSQMGIPARTAGRDRQTGDRSLVGRRSADRAWCSTSAPTSPPTAASAACRLYAVMGEAFARAILGLERPIVGLLNVGAEDVKGNDAVRGAAQILRVCYADLPIEFCGFRRGRRHRRGNGVTWW